MARKKWKHKSIESNAHNASPHVKLNSFKIPPFESLWTISSSSIKYILLFYDEERKGVKQEKGFENLKNI